MQRNPQGDKNDLGKKGAFKGYHVLIGRFYPAVIDSIVNDLKKKGFTVTVALNENLFVEHLASEPDVAWIMR